MSIASVFLIFLTAYCTTWLYIFFQ